MKLQLIGIWVLRLIPAVILLQTLYFKFTASPESVYIFTTIEPWGRISLGTLELVAAILILVPRTTLYGALLAIGLMMGAIFFHLTKLGLVVMDDGGLLFIYAVTVLVCCAILVLIYKQQVINIGKTYL